MLVEGISALSYSFSALTSIAFLALTIIGFQRNQLAFAMLPAAAGGLIWSLSLAIDAMQPILTLQALITAEALRSGAWIYASFQQTRKARPQADALPPLYRPFQVGVFLVTLGLIFLVPEIAHSRSQAYSGYLWGGLLLSVCLIIATEQLLRNSVQHRLNLILSIGLFAIAGYDLFMFAHARLAGSIDPALWSARGAVNSLVTLLVTVTLIRSLEAGRKVNKRVAFSRPMVFYTAGMVFAGGFLTIVGAAGYYLERYGGQWGEVLGVLLMFVAIVVVCVSFFSRRVRALISVLINKHFFVYKYDYRHQWLTLIQELTDTNRNAHLNAATRAASALARVADCEAAVVCLHDPQKHAFVRVAAFPIALSSDQHGLLEPDNTRFVRTLREREWVYFITANNSHKIRKFNKYLPSWAREAPDLALIVPLLVDQHLMGFVLLSQPRHPITPSWEDLDLLKTVGREVASFLFRQRTSEQLTESRQFETYNKLSAFVMHDLKNLIAQQALVVENAARHKENPAFIEDMINTIDNSVNRMNTLLRKLQQTQPLQTESVLIERALINAVERFQTRQPRVTYRSNPSADDLAGLKILADEDYLEMIFSHIIKNAQEATAADGYVDIVLKREGDFAMIQVEDNGCGMDAQFIAERLFRPFDTTKSGKGMGIGVYQTREFLRGLGGDVMVQSEPGVGTVMTLTIPLDTNKMPQTATTPEER